MLSHPWQPDADEVSRLIPERLDRQAFEPLRALTVGQFREWIRDDQTGGDELAAVRPHSGDRGGGGEADEQQGPGARRKDSLLPQGFSGNLLNLERFALYRTQYA